MKIPQKTYTLWRIRIAVFFSAAFIVLICLAVFFGWLILPTVLFCAVLGGLFLITELWLLPLYLKNYSISIDGFKITVSKGIIFKSVALIPNKKLITISQICLPDAQKYNLSAIFIRYYKGFVLIPEIDEIIAKELILSLWEKKP